MNKILVVEDDENLRLTLVDNLEMENYEVSSSSSIDDARQQLNTDHFDLIILVIMLPDGSGYDLCQQIKPQYPDTMVLMLTARTLDSDLLSGFAAGTDDYLTKPYKIEELLARVNALIRRRLPANNKTEISLINGFTVNWQQRTVVKEQQQIHLTKKEFDLLHVLFQHLNTPLSRDDILNKIWGNEVFVDERTVDNFISNIRKHLNLTQDQPYFIKTIRSIGYSLGSSI